MITKELCLKMFVCYREIDDAKKLISDGEKALNDRKPPIPPDCFGYEQTFQMSLPSSLANSRSIVKVEPHLAFAIMRNHIASKEAELIALNEEVKLLYNK